VRDLRTLTDALQIDKTRIKKGFYDFRCMPAVRYLSGDVCPLRYIVNGMVGGSRYLVDSS
jgi:hypothetical protein